MTTQPVITQVEIEALRTAIKSLEAELQSEKLDCEVKIKNLTAENESLKRQIKSLQSSKPLPKVVTKRNR